MLAANTPEAALEEFLGDRQNPELVGDIGTEYGVALAYEELGRYEESRDMFEELLATNQGVIHFHTGLAAAQLGLDDVQAAYETYEAAMELFPRNVPLTVRYSEALLRYGELLGFSVAEQGLGIANRQGHVARK